MFGFGLVGKKNYWCPEVHLANGSGYKLCKLFVYCKKKDFFALYKTTLYNLERASNCKVKHQIYFPKIFFFHVKGFVWV